jgi:hypothetical protein
MRIEISEHVDYPIPPEFVDFVVYISEQEGLDDWTLDIWGCRGEGICEVERKKIRFGLCNTMFRTKHLFLHEVAHALHPGKMRSPAWWKSYEHKRSWQEIFARLLMDHLEHWFWGYQHRKDEDDTPGYSSSGAPDEECNTKTDSGEL